jgi:hypothetical protein
MNTFVDPMKPIFLRETLNKFSAFHRASV